MAEIPTHIVIDTRDGYVFWRGGNGRLFDVDTSARFAHSRNREQYTATYVVVEITLPALQKGAAFSTCANCGSEIIREHYTGMWHVIHFDLSVDSVNCGNRNHVSKD